MTAGLLVVTLAANCSFGEWVWSAMVLSQAWYWVVGAVALVLLLVSGWLKGGSEDGWLPLFVVGLVLAGVFFVARNADRGRRDNA